jgi:hypothetical protein
LKILAHLNILISELDLPGENSMYDDVSPCDWNLRRPEDFPTSPAIKTYVYYPYFEKDIEDLAGKKIFYGNERPR